MIININLTKNTMGHFFYTIGLFLFILDLINLFSFHKIWKINEWKAAYKKVNKKDPVKKDYQSIDDYNISSFSIVYTILLFFWLVFGLITMSWKIYIVLFILGFALGLSKKLLNLITKNEYSKINMLISYPYLIIKSAVILFLVINHFHLHINLI